MTGRGIPEFLFSVKKSNISEAGMGLFTLVPIRKGQKVLKYKGEIKDFNSHVCHEYCWSITNSGICTDARNTEYKCRYVNDAHNTKFKNNLRPFESKRNKEVWYIALRNIKAGEELFISYGGEYWGNRI